MATILTLPTEVHLALLESVAEKSVHDLYSLVLASKQNQEVFKAYWRPVLQKAAHTALRTQLEFILGALQARCSNGNMRINRHTLAGNELNAWSVPPAHDLWTLKYAGDKVQALEIMVWMNHDIE